MLKNLVVGTLLMLSNTSTIASIQETQLVGDWHCTRADGWYESWYKLSADKKGEYYLDTFSKGSKSTSLREIHRGTWDISGNKLTVTVKIEGYEFLSEPVEVRSPIHKEIEVNEFNDGDSVVKNVGFVAMLVDIKKVTENTMSIRGFGEEVDSTCKKVM